jgi:hypothetical protein
METKVLPVSVDMVLSRQRPRKYLIVRRSSDCGAHSWWKKIAQYTFTVRLDSDGAGQRVQKTMVRDLEHFQTWIAALRSRDAGQLNAGIEQGHLSASLLRLANIACATGRALTFDPATEKFQADAEANALLTRKHREPYVVPTETQM